MAVRSEYLAFGRGACSIAHMPVYPSDRLSKLLTAARQSPDFALRMLRQLPAEARAEAVRQWSLGGASEPSRVALGPGLKKCGPHPVGLKTDLSAQLEAFARSVGRVG